MSKSNRTLSFKASENFMKKYDEIIRMEKEQESPLKKSEIFDEMINLYYAKVIMQKSSHVLNEELNIIMQDNFSVFSEKVAIMLNSVHEAIDEMNKKIDGNQKKNI